MVTRTRVLIFWLLAALVAAAVAGPNHIGIIVLIVAAAFVGIVGLGVAIGIRDGLRRPVDDAGPETGEETPGRI
jgi:hypothetical protein